MSVVSFRSDESAQSFDQLMGALQDGRPTPQVVTLPQDAGYLQVVALLDIRAVVQAAPRIGPPLSGEPLPIDPATLTNVSVVATAIVRDAHGLIYRLTAEPSAVAGSAATIVVPLGGGKLDGPLQLAGLQVELSLPSETLTTDARVGVTTMSVGVIRSSVLKSNELCSTRLRRAPSLVWPNSVLMAVSSS